MVVPVEGLGRSCLSRYRAGDSGIVIVIATVIWGGRQDGGMVKREFGWEDS